MAKEKMNIGNGMPCYLIAQSALLVIRYAFDKQMPWWVTFFPTIIIGILIAVLLIVFGVVALKW